MRSQMKSLFSYLNAIDQPADSPQALKGHKGVHKGVRKDGWNTHENEAHQWRQEDVPHGSNQFCWILPQCAPSLGTKDDSILLPWDEVQVIWFNLSC